MRPGVLKGAQEKWDAVFLRQRPISPTFWRPERSEGGVSTLITRRGRPVAVLVPVNDPAGRGAQASLLPMRGSGQGLWGSDIDETLTAARSEWDRQIFRVLSRRRSCCSTPIQSFSG